MLAEKDFLQIIKKIFPKEFPKKIAVAVSGGLDSMALLVLLNKFYAKKTKIFCLTVDHNIRKDSASDARFVADFCKKKSINCTILKSYLKTKPTVNIENNLREVRYNLLQEFCIKNQIENLFIAHHQGDVAENFLIRLFRGSGIDGLSALEYTSRIATSFIVSRNTATQKVQLIRPLLDFSKSDLIKYLQTNKIRWVEDETNEDEKYLRNKIRQFLKTLPDAEVINKRVALASKAILSAKKILQNEMQKNAGNVLQFNQAGYFLLDIKNFKKLDEEIALRYLSWALMDVSGNFYKPRLENLQKIYQLVLQNKINKSHTFYGCVLEKFSAKKIIICREASAVLPTVAVPEQDKIRNLVWDGRFNITIDFSLCCNDDRKHDEMIIGNINAQELNQLIKTNSQLPKLKNPLKKVFYMVPVFKIDGKIVAVPHLNYWLDESLKNKVDIKFQSQSPLLNAN